MTNKKSVYRFAMLWVLGILCICQSSAQNYIPMINDSIYWDVAYAVNDPHPCAAFGVGGPDRYAIGSDTTINSIVYKQIIGYNFLVPSSSGCPPFYVDTILQSFDFYIREDVIGKKVYRFNTNSQLDELLFDFSLQQHDSIFLPSGFSPDIYFYVDTLYTIVTADGVSRKYFESFPRPNTSNTGGFYMEGLGGCMGPFERPFHKFEEGYWVMCISDLNESPIYGSAGSCYNFTNGVDQNEVISDDPVIYPIPATESISIKNYSSYNSYSIVSILGEVIQFRTMFQGRTINISNLNVGQYFIILENDSQRTFARFIKQ